MDTQIPSKVTSIYSPELLASHNMPKNAQHALWLSDYYNRLPNDPSQHGNTKIVLPESTADIANHCNDANGTTRGVDGVDSQIVGRYGLIHLIILMSTCKANMHIDI